MDGQETTHDGSVTVADGAALDQALAEPDQPSSSLDELCARLEAVEQQLGEFHRRSAHREQIIDRLHEDNQRLKQGEHRVLLEPVVSDLIRLYDQLSREARRTPDDSLIGSFADDVAEILDRCGIDTFTAAQGDAYRSDRHKPLAIVPTSDPGLHNTVAEAVAAGFIDRKSERVRRPAQARFYQCKSVED